MNTKSLGLLREFLAAVAAALIAYGYGSESLWQEAAGGLLAAVALVWGILSNEGIEAWFSLARKVLSSVAGVLVISGVLDPDKANVLLGLAVSFLSMGWSLFGKGNIPPPAVPLILLFACAACLLPSCGANGEYPVTGTIYLRDPESGAKAGLVFADGVPPRATLKVPIYDDTTGELIGMADVSASFPQAAEVIAEK